MSNSNNVYNQYDGRYKPIIKSAQKEVSAKGQCKWILAMLEILVLNHLPHIEQRQKDVIEHMNRSTRKIMLFMFIVLMVVLATNPQIISIVGKLFVFVF